VSEPVIKRLSVDRIEGETAVLLEDRRAVELPAEWLPAGVGEGTWLTLTLAEDPEATDDARARIQRLQAQLKRR
jgi:hypothetical protein